ncbi:hypothetical protein AYI70_g3252 [Smittium culicis]|uniref:Uncharacterized protein n=1 Tax=Smittium culicis TaxID=133412 RepID=A0A1R1Y4P7_9FUNG|nr:hypothetical protein AYI70_g3252 [Smittium culicis]
MRPDPYKQKKSLQYQKKINSSKESASVSPTKITKAGQNTTNSTSIHNKKPTLERPANYKKDETADSQAYKKIDDTEEEVKELLKYIHTKTHENVDVSSGFFKKEEANLSEFQKLSEQDEEDDCYANFHPKNSFPEANQSLVPNLNNKLKQTRIKNGTGVAQNHLNKDHPFPGISTKESGNLAASIAQPLAFENSFSDKNKNSQMLDSINNSSEFKESESGRDSLDELESWLDDVL